MQSRLTVLKFHQWFLGGFLCVGKTRSSSNECLFLVHLYSDACGAAPEELES